MTIKSTLFFKRTVLAAEITYRLYNQNTFGHIKFQKLLYLCECTAKMNLHNNYIKQVAGPYDRKFMHTIDTEFKRQKWFNVKKENKNGVTKYIYQPAEKLLNYKKYYDRYFSIYHNEIQYLIDTFKKVKTSKVELIATLYACWENIYKNKKNFSNELLIIDFYNWSEEKKKFTKEQVKSTIEWMSKNKITPQQH